jgi:hypothetical protein
MLPHGSMKNVFEVSCHVRETTCCTCSDVFQNRHIIYNSSFVSVGCCYFWLVIFRISWYMLHFKVHGVNWNMYLNPIIVYKSLQAMFKTVYLIQLLQSVFQLPIE